MDFKYTYKLTKKKCSYGLWLYYTYIHAPRIFFFVAMTILFGLFAWNMQDLLLATLAAIYFVIMTSEFPIYCSRIINILTTTGGFLHETELHFTDHILTTTCGLNVTSTEYKSFTGYFCRKNMIFLLMGRQYFSAAVAKEIFPDQGEELLQCLERDGVKKIHFFRRKEWYLTLLLCVVFVAAWFLFVL